MGRKSRRRKNNVNILDCSVDKNSLNEMFGSDVDKIIKLIFDRMFSELAKYKTISRINKLNHGIDLIMDFIRSSNEVNIGIVQYNLKLLSNKMSKKIKNCKTSDVDTLKSMKKFKYKTRELAEALDTFKNNTMNDYKYVHTIIFKNKNHYFFQNVVNFFPEVINSKNLQGDSLIYNVMAKYLEVLKEDILDLDDCDHYEKIIDIIITNDKFVFDRNEKNRCLRNILNQLDNLDYKGDECFEQRKEKLKNLVEEIKWYNKEKVSINEVKRKYNINHDFDEKVLNSVEGDILYQSSIPKVIFDNFIVTIDDFKAHEIDDALSASILPNGNYLLGIHIADVTSYYDYNSDIVQTAVSRCETIYQGNKILRPIFPLEYSKNKGSLIQGAPRFSESFFFEIAKDGEIVSNKLYKAIVSNDRRCTYNGFNNVLKEGCANKTLNRTAKHLFEVSKIISNTYFPFMYENEEVIENNPAEFIVTTLMSFYNLEVAKIFVDNNYKTVFRSNSNSILEDQELMSLTKDYSKLCCNHKRGINTFVDRMSNCSDGAIYTPDCRHCDLDNEFYTFASSPLRRGADIIVQRGLDLYYHKLGTDKDVYKYIDDLPDKIKILNDESYKIKKFLRECKKRC